ncbi:MAG: hypothetical protein ACOCV4_00620 [Myxococcota bacterium]
MRTCLVIVCVLTLSAGCGSDDDGSSMADGGTCEPEPVTCSRGDSVCGNGTLEPGETCDDGNTVADDGCDPSCQVESTPSGCDLTGHWAAQKVTVSDAPDLGTKATTLNHFYYSIVQDGDSFEVVDSLHCGFTTEPEVGGFVVDLPSQTREALRCINDSDGRTGTSVDDGAGGCDIAFDDFYAVRGLSPKEHYENDAWAGAGVGDGTPSIPAPESPNCECTPVACDCDDVGRYDPTTETPGWEDWDGDCNPGITFRPGDSAWYVSMRDWDRYLGTVTAPDAGEALHDLNEFQLDTEWSNEVYVHGRVGPIATNEEPDRDGNHCVTFRSMEAPDRTAVTDAELCRTVIETFDDVDAFTACD